MKIITIATPSTHKLPEMTIQECLSKKYKITRKAELDSHIMSTIYSHYIQLLSDSYLSIQLRNDILFTEASSPIRYTAFPRQKSVCSISPSSNPFSFGLSSFVAKLIEVFDLKVQYTNTIPKYTNYGMTLLLS